MPPYCNLRIHELSQFADPWARRGLAIVFQSPGGSLRAKFGAKKLPFPIVGDPQHDLYRLYGVELSMLGVAIGFVHPRAITALMRGHMPGKIERDMRSIPADFIIDGKGVVERGPIGEIEAARG